ncbi:UDP-2,4-diacetamido-2,4,6-trideoxy-beta-L-altropyranose hydrolase [Shewanella saliphila]|uniref:UDP-2,4-diacetamido-2,4, 6-trideoxy-beta-L-altropyranose hydrolase n=1 Tax=Shewanella saliphila TaxID=2282698 RepID=A0ABQ2Q3P7_9GAMM|nr:UDP-2,4-diacetamido-2,4,6-trideoxy-beta-L-altropyranose hydrolase [Shewanella saliphila]MCL1099816.1 UDP-2,4-diacetamido-2,4,6-trideoxy-beta-L-altropyranose hydrolase [Shewanella saliphila]GGP44988.1 UDP-2,4-diacetamido-2,4,6-trideoxy-beta-L-altropyranose hydrolase [Shewanella saliphila]
MKQVLIRTDSGHHIGSGHIMRCLTIAKLLSKTGVNVSFCCRYHHGHQPKALEEFTVLMLPEPKRYTQTHGDYPHSNWLGCTEEQDAVETLRELKRAGINPDWIIIDHFSLGAAWEQKLVSETQSSLVVIDGLRDRPHDCQILIDPTLNEREPTCGDGNVFLGPWNIPLREEFAGINPRIRTQLKKVFVCFGGVDKDDVTGQVCEVLTQKSLRNRLDRVDVVVGASYPYIERLKTLCRQHSNYLTLEVQSSRISHLMEQADLAIGAGGGMSWERCAAALPALCWTIADNQSVPNEQLAKLNAIINLGKVTDALDQQLESTMLSLLNEPNKLLLMSECAKKVMLGWNKKSAWVAEIIK